MLGTVLAFILFLILTIILKGRNYIYMFFILEMKKPMPREQE